jgi:hypothetical protein
VASAFSYSGIPTGELNPIYNMPMLRTHKPSHHKPLPAPSLFSWGGYKTFNLSRRRAPGSRCVDFDVVPKNYPLDYSEKSTSLM